jgi:hypothetical protein
LPSEILSQKFRNNLISIAKKFGEITKLILDGAIKDQQRFKGYSSSKLDKERYRGRRSHSFFTDADVVQLRSAIDSSTSASQDMEALLRALADTSYLTTWQSAAITLLEYQGDTNHFQFAPWALSKEYARGVLIRRSNILETFEENQRRAEEQRTQ